MARPLSQILDALASDLQDLRATLSPVLAIATGPLATTRRSRTVQRKRARATRPAARTQRVVRNQPSAKVRAQRVRQGLYLAALRPLSKENRAKVKEVEATKGYPAAITLAKKLKK